MIARKRRLREGGGVVEVHQVPDDPGQGYCIEITWTDDTLSKYEVDAALNAAAARLAVDEPAVEAAPPPSAVKPPKPRPQASKVSKKR